MFHSAKGSLAGMPARHAGTLFPKIKSAIPSDDGREAAPPHVFLAYIPNRYAPNLRNLKSEISKSIILKNEYYSRLSLQRK